jgi:multiple sugar transport system ATP-binding protein
MPKLQLSRVSKTYGAFHALKAIDLSVDQGEFIVMVGPSGCGKSTLLKAIAGLEAITSGSIVINGRDVTSAEPSDRGIAMVFQSYALYPHMSVYENLAFGLQTLGAPKYEIQTKVAKAAKVLQIEPLLQRKPRQLSGGQRQRVAIGRAIVRDPRIFLFDEPLSNLDAELRVQMRVEIAALHKKLGTTMIYVTHDQVEAMTLADRIVVLRLGVVEQIGSPLELYNRPINKFVAGFIGSPKMNLLNIKVTRTNSDAANFDLAGTKLSLPVAIALGAPGITLGVRPEHVVTGNKGALSLGCVRVTHIEQLGGNAFVYGRLFDGQSMTLSLEGQQSVNSEQEIPISIDPALCHVFNAEGLTVARQET